MIAERQACARRAATAPAVTAVTAVTKALSKAWACWWWLLRAHMVDRCLMPRDEALGPPPAKWLEGWPRG